MTRNEQFLSLYNKGLRDKEISNEMNLSLTSIGRIRSSLNLKPNEWFSEHEDELKTLVDQELTDSEIARIFKVVPYTIGRARKQLGLKPSPWVVSPDFETEEDRIKGKMLVRSRARAKQLGLDFNITKEDLILPSHCPFLEIELDYLYKEQNNIKAASLDRIDNTKGYVKGNIMILSVLANTMKNNATLEQLDLFTKNVQFFLIKRNEDILQDSHDLM